MDRTSPTRAVDRSPHNRGANRNTVRRTAIVLALLIVPGAALAATVKGRTMGAQKLLNPVWNEAKDPNAHRYNFREPSPTVRSDLRVLTAYLPKELCIAVLGEKGAAAKQPIKVTVAGGRTTPVTLVVSEGQQIQFDNLDPFPHKLYDTKNKGFQANEQGANKSRTWTPPGAGKYEVRDELTPSIRTWVVVEPRAIASAYPDRKGEFSLDLEPGTYKLRGYFSGEAVGNELEFTVKPNPAEQLLKQPLVVGEPGSNPVDAGAGG